MNTSEISKEMNITFDDDKDSLFDFFLKHKETKVLDIFPKTINDNEKYRTVEAFYQKVLDHCMKKQEFENIENRFYILLRLYGFIMKPMLIFFLLKFLIIIIINATRRF